MKIRIYQIDLDRDENGVSFESLSMLKGKPIDSSIYECVFDSEVDCEDLEAVYRMFNINKPEDYSGRSLSVSDVVEIVEDHNVRPGFYYCDSIGYKEIEFDPNKTSKRPIQKYTVILVEPNQTAKIIETDTRLATLQKLVGGDIEAYYPFDDEVCIVCNEEGKFNGCLPNRGIFSEEGELYDIIFGSFIICGCNSEYFESVPDDLIKKYYEKFKDPERFYKQNNKIECVKYSLT